ncbi:hypothetical protein V7S43_015928 [Phytophthora oleae]|uniref:Uncharacterized protein n=1 Tax=Phytophthora oleae TaxID=2107226 RepID=A0ABD3F1P1_9STRA
MSLDSFNKSFLAVRASFVASYLNSLDTQQLVRLAVFATSRKKSMLFGVPPPPPSLRIFKRLSDPSDDSPHWFTCLDLCSLLRRQQKQSSSLAANWKITSLMWTSSGQDFKILG